MDEWAICCGAAGLDGAELSEYTGAGDAGAGVGAIMGVGGAALRMNARLALLQHIADGPVLALDGTVCHVRVFGAVAASRSNSEMRWGRGRQSRNAPPLWSPTTGVGFGLAKHELSVGAGAHVPLNTVLPRELQW